MTPQELARALQLLIHREEKRGGWHRDTIACKGLPLEKQCSLCLMLQLERSAVFAPVKGLAVAIGCETLSSGTDQKESGKKHSISAEPACSNRKGLS